MKLASSIFRRTYCQLVECVEQSKHKSTRLDYKDKFLGQVMLNVKSKKTRTKSGLIAIEGKRLLQDALKSGISPAMIFYTQRDILQSLTHLNEKIKLYKVPYKDLQLWSDLTTSPGIIGICRKPEPVQIQEKCLPITVLCDQVREPGNLGSILRSASGAGIQKVLLTKGCVDLWDSKVLRGASGAHFHLPVFTDVTCENLSEHIGEDASFLLASHQPFSFDISMPCVPYYEIDYKTFKSTVLVVGGETEGLSMSVFEVAKHLKGKAINIPLCNNIDSLNCASAISVLLFEIKRQLLS